MATLREYSDRSGYYVKHSFAANGRLYHVTYQISENALHILQNKGYRDGSHLPVAMVQQMIAEKDLYTAATGVDGEKIDGKNPAGKTENPFLKLSAQAQMWVLSRVENHPDVTTTLCGNSGDEKEITFDGVPLHFMEQLVALAQRTDGTDFFENLDQTYAAKKR